MRLRIDFPQKAAFVLGVILSIFGIASIIIAVIAFSEKIWGHYLGTGLWCGISMFLTGLSGVVAGQLRRPCAIKTYLITSVISTCLSAVMLVLSAGGLDFDSNFYKHSFMYKKYPRESTSIIHIFSLCLAIFGFISSLTSVGVCIKYLFFQKANNCSSNQSSRENDNLMCTSSESRINNASTSRTPLRERTFSRSNAPRETASIHTTLRENEPLASTSSHNARFHSPRHTQSGHNGNANSNNRHSNETNRFLSSDHLRHEQPCQDTRHGEHIDLPRRITANTNGTPSSTYSDHSQNSYLAAVELMPAASTDFPPQYDDLTPNVFGEDELPPYEEVIQELTDTSDGEIVNDEDLHQERYVNCPVVNADPHPISSEAGTSNTSTTTKTVTAHPKRLATVSSISLPPLSSASGNNKSDVQLSKHYKQNISGENSRSIPARPASDCHISRSLGLRNTNSQSMYAVASEATTQDGNQHSKSSLVSSHKTNPQGVTFHDFSGVVINRAQYQLKSPERTNSSRPKSQPQNSSEALRAGDREYIIVKDSYENCNGDKLKNQSTPETSTNVSPNLPFLPPRLHSPTRTTKSSHSPHHTDHHHHHHHHHHHQRSQNKQTISTSLSAKCEPTKVSHRVTDKNLASECQDILGTSSQNQVSSHSDCSGVKLVPLSKETLSSGNRSKHYNRNKREIILPAKEFDPLAASMKAAEKLSMMENSEKHLRDSHSRNKHSECLVHKSEGRSSKSKEDKSKDSVLVCRPKARLECGKSGVIRYSSDRSQRKSNSTQADRLHQFRWSDSKKRAALQQKLPSSVRDWDTNEHSQQKIVAEFSPASIFQCPPSQSNNLMRMHDMKKVSPSLNRKSGTSAGVHSIGVSTSKSVNPRDEIHVAPEEILKIRTNPDHDREGSAFIVSSSAAAEVRYVPRLFEKSPQKKRASLQDPSQTTNGTSAMPTVSALRVSATTSWSNGTGKSVEHNDSDDHDDSEPLYSNEISSSCSTPSSLMSSGSSMSCAGRELTERPNFALAADVTRKLVSSEQAYMNISEANTVVVPMARISPLTVNKSCSSNSLVSGTSSLSTVAQGMLPSSRTSMGSLQTAIVAKNTIQLQENTNSPELFRSSASKYVNTDVIWSKDVPFRHTPSPTLPPPLLSPSRHNTQTNSVEEVPVALEPFPTLLIPAKVDIIEIAGAESKVLNKQEQDTGLEPVPNLETPNENNHIELPLVAAAVNCDSGEVIEVSDQGRDVGAAAPAAAVVNAIPQVNAESKPMYSILL